MTKNEIVQKNIALSFDFIRYLVRHPDVLDNMPDNADVEFVERDLPFRGSEAPRRDSEKTVLFSVEHTFKEVSLER
ncbi:MAG: DUF5647 family protein [Desulfoferrobacter sp.]